MGLDVNTFHGINENKSTIGKASCGGNLAAEVHVARGIDEADGVIAEEKRDGRALHGDSTALLLVEVIHEPYVSRELRVEDAAAIRGDEVVSEGGFSMVDVGKDADVADLSGAGICHVIAD